MTDARFLRLLRIFYQGVNLIAKGLKQFITDIEEHRA